MDFPLKIHYILNVVKLTTLEKKSNYMRNKHWNSLPIQSLVFHRKCTEKGYRADSLKVRKLHLVVILRRR